MLTQRRVIEAEFVDDRREYARMCSGIVAYRQGRALILPMPDDGFRVLSNGYHNGGFLESPAAVMNLMSLGGSLEWDITGSMDEVRNLIDAYIEKLGHDRRRTVSLETAASMDNASVGTVSAEGIDVSIAATAGIRGNGGCAGDPASYDEAENLKHVSGTINIIAVVDAEMSDSAMLRLMTVITQAKSSVVEEMQAKSLYSHRLATGSGTDQIAIVIRHGNGKTANDIGLASEFGRAVCDLVRRCLFDTFDRQSMMNMEEQCDAMVQLSRFGITEPVMKDEIRFQAPMKHIIAARPLVFRDPYTVSVFTAALRVQDSIDAGRTDPEGGLNAVKRMVSGALGERIIRTELNDLRLEEKDSIPGFLRLFLAMLLERRAVELWEADG